MHRLLSARTAYPGTHGCIGMVRLTPTAKRPMSVLLLSAGSRGAIAVVRRDRVVLEMVCRHLSAFTRRQDRKPYAKTSRPPNRPVGSFCAVTTHRLCCPRLSFTGSWMAKRLT